MQGGSNMTGTNCDLFTHNQSRSYLNHLVYTQHFHPSKNPRNSATIYVTFLLPSPVKFFVKRGKTPKLYGDFTFWKT
jgi:hypothetical protein